MDDRDDIRTRENRDRNVKRNSERRRTNSSTRQRRNADNRTRQRSYSSERIRNSEKRAVNNKPGKGRMFSYQMQANLLLAFGIIIFLLFLLICRLIIINVKDGSRYAKNVLGQQSYTSSEIPYKRGDILDRNGIVMATSIKVYNLVIDPSFILTISAGKYKYKDAAVEVLTEYFQYSKDEILSLLDEKKDAKYYILEKKVDSEIVDGFDEFVDKYEDEHNALVKGIWFEEEYERQYPLNSVASSVIGFTYDKNAGNWGIEGSYNEQLNGSTGRSYGYYDSELNLERTVKSAIDGNNVVSTIDSNIQQIVENHINRFNTEIGCKNASIIIANPNTGEIIAMASSNGMYNLNKPRDLSPWYSEEEISAMTSEEKLNNLNAIWRNFCISDSYEPGSTYKPFVIAAGLEEGILLGNETYYCDGKEVVVEKTNPIRCAKREGHGIISLKQAMMFSCNDALMLIGKNLGRDRFSKYQKIFGFGQRTGIDIVGENVGVVYDSEGFNPLELATSSFGQGLNVTMVQMVAAFSSLVNGGNYYEPHLVKQILNSNGAVVKDIEPTIVKKVISKETSNKLIDYMKATVDEGTAKVAQVEGYSVGGKTGTAQKLPRKDNKYLVSFIGFAPCEEPELVIYSIVDEVNVEKQAQSSYAQQLASDIMKDVFPFIDVFPVDGTDVNYFDPNGPTEEPEATKTPEDENEPEKTDEPEQTLTPNDGNEDSYEFDLIDSNVENNINNIIDNVNNSETSTNMNTTTDTSTTGLENSAGNNSINIKDNTMNKNTNTTAQKNSNNTSTAKPKNSVNANTSTAKPQNSGNANTSTAKPQNSGNANTSTAKPQNNGSANTGTAKPKSSSSTNNSLNNTSNNKKNTSN